LKNTTYAWCNVTTSIVVLLDKRKNKTWVLLNK
jgi:hypothetical protein